jgi:uncharacterized protein (TIGR02147 family)
MQLSKDSNISIYDFTSFRTFLKAYADQEKKRNTHWSYSQWAKKLGLQGTASLTMVVNGQRNPGPHLVSDLIRHFKFNEKEKAFFENLVNLEKVNEDSGLKYLVLKELQRLSPLKNFELLDERKFDVIANWYNFAIRQMTRLKDFKNNPTWIAKNLRFSITEKQIKQAIQNLIDLNLVKENRGKLSKTQTKIVTTNDIPSEALKRHHEQSLENAKKSVRETPLHLRESRAITIVMQESKIPKAQQLIREFSDEFIKLMDTDDGDNVYQMAIHLFPLTKLNKEKE